MCVCVPRFTWGNGGFGDAQLQWLREVLGECAETGEQVLLFGHNPVHPRVVNDPDGLAYDYEAMLQIINDFQNCVVGYVAGHDHLGGYTYDEESRVHHLTVPSPLEAQPGTGSRFIVMDLNSEQLVLHGSAAVVENPVPRAFVSTSGACEDKEGAQRLRTAQLQHRYVNFATHWGVVWSAKVAQKVCKLYCTRTWPVTDWCMRIGAGNGGHSDAWV